MNKYSIEFSSKYKHLSSGPVVAEDNSPKSALVSYLVGQSVYCDVLEADFSDADARVVLIGGTDNSFYRIVEKEPIIKNLPNAIEYKDIVEVQKLLKKGIIEVYHGTKDPALKADFSFDNRNNDYGKGFYTTPYPELGKEWAYTAYTKGDKGYLYKYTIDLSGLDVLDLTQMDSAHWIAELITNRTINVDGREALKDTIEQFKHKYKLDTSKTDVIIGYRADDSYFTYAEDFLSGAIYKDTLESALRNDNLGIQVFIKSEKAFKALKQEGEPIEVPEKYKDYYQKRDKSVRKKYQEDRKNQVSRSKIRVYDLLR